MHSNTTLIQKYKNIVNITDNMYHNATISNNLGTMQWLLKTDCRSYKLIRYSVKNMCDIKILQWLSNSLKGPRICRDIWSRGFRVKNDPKTNIFICWFLKNKKFREEYECVKDFELDMSINLYGNNNITMRRWAIENNCLKGKDICDTINNLLQDYYCGNMYTYSECELGEEILGNVDWILSIGCTFEILEQKSDEESEEEFDGYSEKNLKEQTHYKGPFIFENNPFGIMFTKRRNYDIVSIWYTRYEYTTMLNLIGYPDQSSTMKPLRSINKFLYFMNQLIYNNYLQNIKTILYKKFNKFNIMNWITENVHYLNKGTFLMAKECGNILMMNLLIRNKCPYDKHNIPWLPGYDKEKMLKKDIKCQIWDDELTIFDVKWLYGYRQDPNINNPLIYLDRNSRYDPYMPYLTKNILEDGLLTYLDPKSILYPMNKSVIEVAVKAENIDCVKLLLKNKCPIDESVIKAAVITENISIIYLLIENKCPIDDSVIKAAVKTKNINVILLLDNKYPINAFVFETVVKTENINIIQLLIDKKCPMDVSVFEAAVITGNVNIVRLLLNNKCPY